MIPLLAFFALISLAGEETASNSKPILDININPECVEQGDTVQFIPIFRESFTPAAISWSFGDGNASSSFSPKHCYSIGQFYIVACIIADTIGNEYIYRRDIDILSRPSKKNLLNQDSIPVTVEIRSPGLLSKNAGIVIYCADQQQKEWSERTMDLQCKGYTTVLVPVLINPDCIISIITCQSLFDLNRLALWAAGSILSSINIAELNPKVLILDEDEASISGDYVLSKAQNQPVLWLANKYHNRSLAEYTHSFLRIIMNPASLPSIGPPIDRTQAWNSICSEILTWLAENL